MITADRLKMLTTFTTDGLQMALAFKDGKGPRLKTATFVGMTNGNQFCYVVSYNQQEASIKNLPTIHEIVTKVFITYDPVSNKVTATIV